MTPKRGETSVFLQKKTQTNSSYVLVLPYVLPWSSARQSICLSQNRVGSIT